MKKLEDLPKRADFKVPEGYFEDLPMRIQSRVTASPGRMQARTVWALRYTLPVITLLLLGVFWYQQSHSSIEDQLESIDEVQLSFFIDDPDLTSEELVETVAWTTSDLDALEEEVFSALDASGDGLDIVIDDLDLENL